MPAVLLSKAQEIQVRRLRFEPETERDYQDSVSRERIRRIQIVVVLVLVLFLVAPTPKEVSSSPGLQFAGLTTFALTVLMAVFVFIPKFRRAAVFALPLWEFYQQAAFGLASKNPQPYMQVSIQLALAIVIVSAVRLPAVISLVYCSLTAAGKVLAWTGRGLPVSETGGPTVYLFFGFVFLIVGAYLTETADRRSFLVSRLLAAEREKTQALLTNVLPEEIAEQLRDSDKTVATRHDAVSVLFADVVNFTPFAASRPAEEVIGFLSELFTRFDALVENSGLEKIKTVGDAYMVAAGLPKFRPDHVAALADLALEMKGASTAMGAAVRFGLHTGPAIAGVLGTKRFMYDIWGPTVNLAARLEANSAAGEILVSGEVKDVLAASHEFGDERTVDIKGVGPTRVCNLVRRKASRMPIEAPQ